MLGIVVLIGIIGKTISLRQAEETAEKIKKENKNKEAYLKQCYNLITKRFRTKPYGFLLYPWRNFYLGNMWNPPGKVLPCHILSSMLKRCLLKRFHKKEIRSVWIFLSDRNILHNYLKVKVGQKWVSVDPWGYHNHIHFGENMLTTGYGARGIRE